MACGLAMTCTRLLFMQYAHAVVYLRLSATLIRLFIVVLVRYVACPGFACSSMTSWPLRCPAVECKLYSGIGGNFMLKAPSVVWQHRLH